MKYPPIHKNRGILFTRVHTPGYSKLQFAALTQERPESFPWGKLAKISSQR